MINKVVSIKDAVKVILTNYPETRDNDRILMLKIWAYQNSELRHLDYMFLHFARGFINGEYADPESIRRSRQKIQEQHPELRGEHYKEKKYNLEPEMRDGINKLKT